MDLPSLSEAKAEIEAARVIERETKMTPASVLYMSMSLDGYIAGPNDDPDNPGGDGFMRLHDWYGFADGKQPEQGIPKAGARISEAAQYFLDEGRETGAVVSGRGRLERYFAAREQEHIEEKRRIAQAAAALVRSGQQVFLDASTTALQVARLIKEREDLVVVTNGLYTALELNFSTGITTIVVGGTMRYRSSSLVGSFNNDSLRRLRFDVGFFGARGVTARDGLMESDVEEALLKQKVVSASDTVVGVVDSSKFGVTAFTAFALPHEVDRIVTDDAAPPDMIAELRALNIRVELV